MAKLINNDPLRTYSWDCDKSYLDICDGGSIKNGSVIVGEFEQPYKKIPTLKSSVLHHVNGSRKTKGIFLGFHLSNLQVKRTINQTTDEFNGSYKLFCKINSNDDKQVVSKLKEQIKILASEVKKNTRDMPSVNKLLNSEEQIETFINKTLCLSETGDSVNLWLPFSDFNYKRTDVVGDIKKFVNAKIVMIDGSDDDGEDEIKTLEIADLENQQFDAVVVVKFGELMYNSYYKAAPKVVCVSVGEFQDVVPLDNTQGHNNQLKKTMMFKKFKCNTDESICGNKNVTDAILNDLTSVVSTIDEIKGIIDLKAESELPALGSDKVVKDEVVKDEVVKDEVVKDDVTKDEVVTDDVTKDEVDEESESDFDSDDDDSDLDTNNVSHWIRDCVMKSTDETDISSCYAHYKKQCKKNKDVSKTKKEFVDFVCVHFGVPKKSKTLLVTLL